MLNGSARAKSSISKQQSQDGIKVEVTALSQYINGPVGLLKIDCEGSEIDVLKSIKADQFKHIKRISLEYHDYIVPHQAATLKSILESVGYKCRIEPNPYDLSVGHLFAEV